MIDEFPSLGKLDFFEQSLAYTASYGIKAYLICQSLNQLDGIYGTHNAILDNCHIRIVYASNDERTAERISRLLGQSTVIHTTSSYSGRMSSALLQQVSSSDQHHARPLLTAGEILTLHSDEALILSGNHFPIRAKKIRYYADRTFTARLLPAAETLSYP